MSDAYQEAALALVRVARERGVDRIADLGDIPPYGTPEWDEWLEENPPLDPDEEEDEHHER
jgi:sugar/nucleoside kinase (ribokinase family)